MQYFFEAHVHRKLFQLFIVWYLQISFSLLNFKKLIIYGHKPIPTVSPSRAGSPKPPPPPLHPTIIIIIIISKLIRRKYLYKLSFALGSRRLTFYFYPSRPMRYFLRVIVFAPFNWNRRESPRGKPLALSLASMRRLPHKSDGDAHCLVWSQTLMISV